MGKNDTINWDELEAEEIAAGRPARQKRQAAPVDVEPESDPAIDLEPEVAAVDAVAAPSSTPAPQRGATRTPRPSVEAEAFDMDEIEDNVIDEPAPVVRPAQFVNLNDEPGYGDRNGIELLRDVEVDLTVELGSTRMLIKHILGLRPGSVVELNRLAGEPVDIVINKTLIARGEVVVVDEKFAIRVVEIVPPERRLATA
jgi:flagellar motor switch protein FliN/FliY